MMTLVQKLRVLGAAAGDPNVHDDAADRINELETAAAHPLSNPNLIAMVARLEDALRYWSGYDDIDFAVQQAKARGELSPPNSGELSMDEWQPIETAPKDGTVILLGCPAVGAMKDPGSRRVYEGLWHGGQKTFTSVNGFLLLTVATHWMPLPSPPNSGGAELAPAPEAFGARALPNWDCTRCGQKNSGWAKECGRCELVNPTQSDASAEPT